MSPLEDCDNSPVVGRSTSSIYSSCPWPFELWSGHAIESGNTPRRMEVTTSSHRQRTLTETHSLMKQFTLGVNVLTQTLADSVQICVSTNKTPPSSAVQHQGGEGNSAAGRATQPWFPDLLELLTGSPWTVQLRKDLLSQARGSIWHPNLEQRHLHVWPLSRAC